MATINLDVLRCDPRRAPRWSSIVVFDLLDLYHSIWLLLWATTARVLRILRHAANNFSHPWHRHPPYQSVLCLFNLSSFEKLGHLLLFDKLALLCSKWFWVDDEHIVREIEHQKIVILDDYLKQIYVGLLVHPVPTQVELFQIWAEP